VIQARVLTEVLAVMEKATTRAHAPQDGLERIVTHVSNKQ